MTKTSWLLTLLLFLFPLGGTLLAQEENTEPDSGLILQEPLAEDEYVDFEDPFAEDEIEVSDPLEPMNRAFFWFNDKLYFYLLKPVARTYRVVPEPARKSVSNFFTNLAAPVRFVNSLLQLKFRGAGEELGRFLLNSTVGVVGFLDPAEDLGLNTQDEDLGQTFGRYGIGSGFYLVLPVFGPSNVRDGVGRIGDFFLDPVPYAVEDYTLIGVKAYDRVNWLSLDDNTYEKIKEQALDPYLFVRNAYAQRRAALIRK